MSCSPDTPVTWSDMHALATQIESVATQLSVPVVKLTTNAQSPFSMSSCPSLNGAYTFELAIGTPNVNLHWISPGLRDFGQWQPPNEAVRQLIADQQCIFVHSEDACWCSMGWWIRQGAVGFKLLEKEEAKCCPTLEIPTVLDRDQTWINDAAVQSHLYRERDYVGQQYSDDADRCAGTSGLALQMLLTGRQSSKIAEYDLYRAQREIHGYITWMIIPRYYQEMWDMIIEIVSGSCGAKKDQVKKAETNSYLCEYSPVRIVDILWTLQEDTNDLQDRPGCIQEHGCSIDLPWNTDTCGAGFCDGNLKQYCQTLLDMETIANALSGMLHPKGAPDLCSGLLRCGGGSSNVLGPCESSLAFDMNVYSPGGTVPLPENSTEFTLNYVAAGPGLPWTDCHVDTGGRITSSRFTVYWKDNVDIWQELLAMHGFKTNPGPWAPACKKQWYFYFTVPLSSWLDSYFQNIEGRIEAINQYEPGVGMANPNGVEPEAIVFGYDAPYNPAGGNTVVICSYAQFSREGQWDFLDTQRECSGDVGTCGELENSACLRSAPGWSGVVYVENSVTGGSNTYDTLYISSHFALLGCCKCSELSTWEGGDDPYMTCDTTADPCPGTSGEC